MMKTSDDQHDPTDLHETDPATAQRKEPGGPYFGRLLIVLLLAVAFCGVMTWYLSSVMVD